MRTATRGGGTVGATGVAAPVAGGATAAAGGGAVWVRLIAGFAPAPGAAAGAQPAPSIRSTGSIVSRCGTRDLLTARASTRGAGSGIVLALIYQELPFLGSGRAAAAGFRPR